MIKISNSQGDLTDIQAEKEALVRTWEAGAKP